MCIKKRKVLANFLGYISCIGTNKFHFVNLIRKTKFLWALSVHFNAFNICVQCTNLNSIGYHVIWNDFVDITTKAPTTIVASQYNEEENNNNNN